MNLGSQQQIAQTGEGYPPRVLAVVERLRAEFPDVGVSLGTVDGAFSAPAGFWAAGGAGIEESLAYQDFFRSRHDGPDPGRASDRLYSRQVSVVLGALYLGAGVQAEIAGIRFEDWSRLHQDRAVAGKRYHFHVDLAERSQQAECIGVFERGFTAHLAPVIAILKKRSGLSSGAQWRLAADSLAGTFLEIGRAIGDEVRGMAEALAIVKRPGSRLFSEEICYEEISATDPASGAQLSCQYRIRCGCCLYFKTEGGGFCDTCVLLEPDDRRARLAARLMQNGGA